MGKRRQVNQTPIRKTTPKTVKKRLQPLAEFINHIGFELIRFEQDSDYKFILDIELSNLIGNYVDLEGLFGPPQDLYYGIHVPIEVFTKEFFANLSCLGKRQTSVEEKQIQEETNPQLHLTVNPGNIDNLQKDLEAFNRVLWENSLESKYLSDVKKKQYSLINSYLSLEKTAKQTIEKSLLNILALDELDEKDLSKSGTVTPLVKYGMYRAQLYLTGQSEQPKHIMAQKLAVNLVCKIQIMINFIEIDTLLALILLQHSIKNSILFGYSDEAMEDLHLKLCCLRPTSGEIIKRDFRAGISTSLADQLAYTHQHPHSKAWASAVKISNDPNATKIKQQIETKVQTRIRGFYDNPKYINYHAPTTNIANWSVALALHFSLTLLLTTLLGPVVGAAYFCLLFAGLGYAYFMHHKKPGILELFETLGLLEPRSDIKLQLPDVSSLSVKPMQFSCIEANEVYDQEETVFTTEPTIGFTLQSKYLKEYQQQQTLSGRSYLQQQGYTSKDIKKLQTNGKEEENEEVKDTNAATTTKIIQWLPKNPKHKAVIIQGDQDVHCFQFPKNASMDTQQKKLLTDIEQYKYQIVPAKGKDGFKLYHDREQKQPVFKHRDTKSRWLFHKEKDNIYVDGVDINGNVITTKSVPVYTAEKYGYKAS